MPMFSQLKIDLNKAKDAKRAKAAARYFKTGKGDYGEGDRFLGIPVPITRRIIKKYYTLPLPKLEQLLKSPLHEHRLAALLILVEQFKKGNRKEQQRIVKMYLRNTKHINNWDLVDTSAPEIIGAYLFAATEERKLLDKLAASKSLWEQRIAILATLYFIQQKRYTETLHIAEKLLHHKHDLIHKAIGWMLREIGNKDQKTEEAFLKKHYKTMPRTALRYAIEKFPESSRKAYLQGKI